MLQIIRNLLLSFIIALAITISLITLGNSHPGMGAITGAVLFQEQQELQGGVQQEVPQEELAETLADDASKESAKQALALAEADIKEMENSGLAVLYVTDLYNEAKDAYDSGNMTRLMERAALLRYSDPELATTIYKAIDDFISSDGKVFIDYAFVVKKAEEIKARKEKGFVLIDRIELLEIDIAEFSAENTGADVSYLNEALANARAEFADERYPKAEESINNAYAWMEEYIVQNSRINAFVKASQRNIGYILRHHPLEALAVLAMFVAAISIAINEGIISISRKRIKDMELEEKVVNRLIKKVQTDYYQRKTIPKNLFLVKTERYKDKLLKIKEKRPVMEAQLRRFRKRRRFYLFFLKN